MLCNCYSGAVNESCTLSRIRSRYMAGEPSHLHVSYRLAQLTFTNRTFCLIICTHLELGQHSGYCGKVRWFDSRQGQDIFCTPHRLWGSPQPPVERVPGEFSPRFKARGVKLTSKPPSKVMWKHRIIKTIHLPQLHAFLTCTETTCTINLWRCRS
jgi:hypothetical protein